MDETSVVWIGIDYGSKLAGTTVMAQWTPDEKVIFAGSEKKKDADAFLFQRLAALPQAQVFIDAPLSLPGKYRYPDRYDDFFYRQADRELRAMSPMFLGGLTARAMRLREKLADWSLFEAYPAALARHWNLQEWHYKKQKEHLPTVVTQIQKQLPLSINPNDLISWHHVDALLALATAYRYSQQKHDCYGLPEEGLIFV